MPWLTVAAAAREIGRKRQQLALLVKENRLPKGFVDRSGGRTLVLSDGLAAVVADAVRPRTGSRFLEQPTTAAEVRAQVAALPKEALPDINESRQRNEHLKGELLELELGAKRGELVDQSRVKKEAFHTARMVRDRLLQLPARIANDMAAITDATALCLALEQELRQCLIEMGDWLPLEAHDLRD